jgi:hypothetical protein
LKSKKKNETYNLLEEKGNTKNHSGKVTHINMCHFSAQTNYGSFSFSAKICTAFALILI